MIKMMLRSELNWLKESSKEMNSIAEIGCWKGDRSTKIFLDYCKGTVYAIDHFRGSWPDLTALFVHGNNIFNEFMKNVGHYSNLKIIRKPSLEATEDVPSIDMVFIDADHTYKAVKKDILAWILKTNILLCGHDYGMWPGVKKAVDELIPDVCVFKTIWFKWMRDWHWIRGYRTERMGN